MCGRREMPPAKPDFKNAAHPVLVWFGVRHGRLVKTYNSAQSSVRRIVVWPQHFAATRSNADVVTPDQRETRTQGVGLRVALE